MKKILVINGHQPYPFAEGRLNQTMFENIVEFLSVKNEVKTSVIHKGYVVESEEEKFVWADVIIFQTPIFWYSIPGAFKTYIDRVYKHGMFFEATDTYGKGGMLKGKKYMFSLTMNTPENEFATGNKFFDGKSLDDVIVHLHKTHQYCGMESIKTFAAYDVVKHPQVLEFLEKVNKHLHENVGA